MKFGPIRLMTVTTHAAVSFSFSFVFTRDHYNTHYITYFMAHSFYACLAPPVVVGVLLTCQSLDPEYKTNMHFFRCISKKKTSSYIRVNTVLGLGIIWILSIPIPILMFIDSQFRFQSGLKKWSQTFRYQTYLCCVSFCKTFNCSWIPWTKISRLHKNWPRLRAV